MTYAKMLARAPLPKAVNAVGDRIGLDYNVNRKLATRKYIEESQEQTRLDLDTLKNTFYSLSESRTIKTKQQEGFDDKKLRTKQLQLRNPLKLSSRVRKSLYKLTNQDKQHLHYITFEKINQVWLEYAQKIEKLHGLMGIFRLDLHGCLLKCTVSKNPTLVGSQGIVVQETKNTFYIIKQTNRLITLPKRESIFEFKIGENVYRIHGCNLLFTTQTRSKVKYKRDHVNNGQL